MTEQHSAAEEQQRQAAAEPQEDAGGGSAVTNVITTTEFMISEVDVAGLEEDRFADDESIDPQLRGKVRQPATVDVTFRQIVTLPIPMPGPDGRTHMASAQVGLSAYLAKGLQPDIAIALGEQLVAEGNRVKETMKEQPVETSGKLAIATDMSEARAVAERADAARKLAGGNGRGR